MPDFLHRYECDYDDYTRGTDDYFSELVLLLVQVPRVGYQSVQLASRCATVMSLDQTPGFAS